MAQSDLFKQKPDVFLTSLRSLFTSLSSTYSLKAQCRWHWWFQRGAIHSMWICPYISWLIISFHSSAKISTATLSSKPPSNSHCTNGSPTSTTVPAKPQVRRALLGPRGNTTSSQPETPSPPSMSQHLPPLLELPPAGKKIWAFLSVP